MQKESRQIFPEILWLTISLGLATLLAMFLLRGNFLTGTLDIHLHDTYFVMASEYIFVSLFLLVAFVVYFLKELRQAYKRSLPNWILLGTGLSFIVALAFLNKMFSQAFSMSGTLYPPLSSLGPDKLSEMIQDPVAKFVTVFFTVIQMVTLLLLLWVAYRWGTQ